MSPVSRIVLKTLRSPQCLQNLSFLVEIEGALENLQIRKKWQSTEKTPFLKNRIVFKKIYWWICIEKT